MTSHSSMSPKLNPKPNPITGLKHRDGAAELDVFTKQLSEDARLAIGMGLIRKAQLQPKYKLPRESHMCQGP